MKNFAKLKESLYNEVINCIKEDRPRAKQLIKGYIKILKRYPALMEAFHIHNNFDHAAFKNEDVKHGFIIENLTAIKRLNKEELHLGLEALDRFIKGNKIQYTTDLNELSSQISNLMLNVNKVEKSVENNKAIEFIIESVLKRNVDENQRPPVNHKLFKKTAQKNYNAKYSQLSETEKKIVKSFFTGDKKAIAEQYQTIVTELKNTLNSKITGVDDNDTKIKLYEVKDKLLEVPTEITLEHFKKLLQLQESLQ